MAPLSISLYYCHQALVRREILLRSYPKRYVLDFYSTSAMSVIISPMQKNATYNMLGPPLLNSKLDLRTANCLGKLIRSPLKLL